MTELYHWFDLIGIAVFAMSGTLIAYDKKMDGFGVVFRYFGYTTKVILSRYLRLSLLPRD